MNYLRSGLRINNHGYTSKIEEDLARPFKQDFVNPCDLASLGIRLEMCGWKVEVKYITFVVATRTNGGLAHVSSTAVHE